MPLANGAPIRFTDHPRQKSVLFNFSPYAAYQSLKFRTMLRGFTPDTHEFFPDFYAPVALVKGRESDS